MTSSTAPAPVSGVRVRTRRAILDAAAAVWSRDFSLSLTQIADRAEVSRSTLHRYFPERQDLVDALLLDTMAVLSEAGGQAVVAEGAAIDGLEHLLRALVDVGERVIFMFSDPHRFDDNPHWGEDDEDSLVELIERAQREGALDPAVDPRLIQSTYYALVYVAAEAINQGIVPRHVAGDTAVRTFLRGLSAR